MSEKGIKGPEIQRVVGVSSGTVSFWKSGQTKPRGANLVKLAALLGVSESWLAEGVETNEIRDRSTEYAVSDNAQWSGGIEPWSSDTPLNPDEVELPFYSEVELAAGAGSYQVQENTGLKLRFAKSTLRKSGVDEKNAACAVAKGSSMAPVIPDGSTIGVDLGATSIVDGKMYAIDHGGMLRVKLLYRMPNGGIRLKSFNSEEYPDETYDKENAGEIKIIGRVFWYSVLL